MQSDFRKLTSILTDGAYAAAQLAGKTPALCKSNSVFMLDLQKCNECVDNYSPTGFNSTLLGQLSEFQQFLDYCNTTLASSSEQSQVQSLLAKESDLLASAQSLSAQIASLGITTSASATQSSTLLTTKSGSQGVVTVYAAQTGTGSGGGAGSSSHSSAAVIAPAVVVPVVGVAVIVVLGFFFVRRRRLRKVKDISPDNQPPIDDKPQLHSDEFRPELEGSDRAFKTHHELGQSFPPAELPVQEEVAREMDGRG
jgi:hypothetical protein